MVSIHVNSLLCSCECAQEESKIQASPGLPATYPGPWEACCPEAPFLPGRPCKGIGSAEPSMVLGSSPTLRQREGASQCGPPCRWPLCNLGAGGLSGKGCTKSTEPVLTDLPSHCSWPWSLPQVGRGAGPASGVGHVPAAGLMVLGLHLIQGRRGMLGPIPEEGRLAGKGGQGKGGACQEGSHGLGVTGSRELCTVYPRVRQSWGRLLGPGSQLRYVGGATPSAMAAEVAREGLLDSMEALGIPEAQVSARSRCRQEGRQVRSLYPSRRKETHG